MPSRTYECALRLEGHRVPVAQRNSHEQASAELSLAAVKEQVDDARNSLVNTASAAEDTAHVNVRWPEMLRLPYWNSNQMLVIDPMQFVSEGPVDYHCHRVHKTDEIEFGTMPMPLLRSLLVMVGIIFFYHKMGLAL
ncbi:hypothetical protein MVEN_02323300 [Mycena venus]|uniref:Uncharacterized protein n=1 Tax=Mycena venus TaxID=2733690 RepID=A0A8H6X530_9AGAR|nr:hypothetical protein MVEN_02323300 [Mycena venus]